MFSLHRSLYRAILLEFCIFFWNPNVLHSQSQDIQSWNSAFIEWNFYPSLLFEFEIDYYTLISEGDWRQYGVTSLLEYYPNNSFDLIAGLYHANTKQNDTEITNEIRPLIGFRWNIIKPEKRIYLRGQFKYEYRFFKTSADSTSVNAGRLRIRADLYVPINQKSFNEDKNLYGIISTEDFINLENDIKEKYQSSFRQFLGLGYRFNYPWRVELLYVFQTSRDSINDEIPDSQTHAIYLKIKYFISG